MKQEMCLKCHEIYMQFQDITLVHLVRIMHEIYKFSQHILLLLYK